jgi:hypothetical protein
MSTGQTTASTTRLWRGWYRASKRHKWEALAEGGDYGETLNRLLDAVADRPGRGGELLVSRENPNCGRRR